MRGALPSWVRRTNRQAPHNKPLNLTESLTSWERAPPPNLCAPSGEERAARAIWLRILSLDLPVPANSAGYGQIRYTAALMTEPNRPATIADLARVMIALIALVSVLGATFSIESLVFSLNANWHDESMREQTQLFAFVDITIRLFVAWALYYLREPIAVRIAPEATLPELRSEQVLPLVLAGVGAFLFVSRVPPAMAMAVQQPDATSLTRVLVQAGFGLGLFFGARGITNLWDLARSAR